MAVSHANEVAAVVQDNLDTYKGLTPAAPVEVAYQTATYIDAYKRQRGNVTADFPDVVFATDGTPITVAAYEIAGQQQGLTPLLPFQTIGHSPVSSVVAANLPPGTTWLFKVRAVAGSAANPGLWSPETSVTITADTTPPPQPSALTATAVSGGVKLVWDGLAAGGGTMPGDFDHTEIAFGMAANPTTVIDTFPGASFTIVPKSSYNTVHYFRHRAVDTSGNASPWSAASTAIVVPLVDADLILSALDGAKTTITNISSAAILDGAILAAKLADNAVTQAKLAAAVQTDLAKGVTALSNQTGINANISALQTSVDGKTAILNSTVDAAAGTPGKTAGDRWQKWSTLAAGGKLLASWRWTGSLWLPELMDPTYLPLVDIGAGTFGSLAGSRITAKSLTVDQILVSRGANLAVDPDMQDITNWTGAGVTASATGGQSGRGSITIAQGSTQQGSYYAQTSNARRIKVVQGGYYRVGMWAYPSADMPVNSAKFYVRLYDDAQGGNILATDVAGQVAQNGSILPANTWSFVSGMVQIPAGTPYTNAVIGLYKQATYTTGTVIFSDPSFQQAMAGELIVDGSITGTEVNASSVAAAVGSFLTINVSQLNATTSSIGQAVIDKLWTDVVNSRKITTDMLVVTGDNMIWNGSGQNLTNASWSAWAFDAADKAPGTYGSFTVSTQTTLTLANDQPVMPVSESTGYVLEGWIKASVAGSNVFLESMETGGTDPNPRYILSYYAVPTTWTRFSSPVITSAGQTGMQFRLFANHSSGTVFNATQKIAGLRFRKQDGADVIVNGGILTRHLTVTDDMVVALLNVHKIKAVDIDANDIVADTGQIGILRSGILIADAVNTTVLKADAITSKHTITGATFQTTTTANRGIKFTSTGLKMWDSGGVQTVDLNATTGYATITGRLRTAADGSPGVVLIPPVESTDGSTMAMWLAPDVAALPGGSTAGVWMSNAPLATATPINIRGQSAGGIYLYEGIDLLSTTGSVPYISSHHGAGIQMTSYAGTMYLTSLTEIRLKSSFNTVIDIATNKQLNLLTNGAAYNRTVSASANAVIYTDGNVFKVASASKYKILPEVMALDDRLLDEVAVKDWIDIGMAERYADSFDLQRPLTETEDREFRALSLERIPGAIAEDVEAAGGEKFVVRDIDGEIDSLMYDRFALARTEILKRRVAEQAAEIAELRTLFAELKASLPA